jgi:small subunit ribosomal protein S13
MARIAGVNVPDNKQVQVALTYIFGIGTTSAKKILTAANVETTVRVKDISEPELNRIRTEITEHFEVEGDLAQHIRLNINRLKDINSFRGIRHKANLPVRGQRTRTNARTKRGKRMTVGSGRTKAPAPK